MTAPNVPGTTNRQESTGLGRELGGDLPCVFCGYNLRGLSIRSMCPECGTGVRATILALVDPQAGELQPIRLPRLVASGVVLWATGAIAVMMACWLPHVADGLRLMGFMSLRRPNIELAVAMGLGTSMLGSLALIRPHAHIPWVHTLMSVLATLLYVPLAWAMWNYQVVTGQIGGARYFNHWQPSADSTKFLVLSCGIIAAIIMLERPIARLLVARSLVMRTGRVDRQTMYAMAIATLIIALGGAVGYFAPAGPMWQDLAKIAGQVLIAFGSILLSIGLVGSLVDCTRIASAILAPSPTLKQVIREGHPKTRFGIPRGKGEERGQG